MANTHIDISVDCLSPAGSDDTVKPAASLFLSCCVFYRRPVESMKVLNGPETPPR